MKNQLKLLPLILLLSLLTACGVSATATAEMDLSNAYTAAAATISAQSNISTPRAIQTTFLTATPFSFPTIPVTMTQQSSISYSAASTANGCSNAIYVSDVTIPDGTVLAPGESFAKTWDFQNTGSCEWTENYLITFVSGTDMDGDDTEIGETVSTGSSGEISVSLVAPDSEGTYTGYWRLADEDGNAFGQSVYVQIVVSEGASTLTPTVTPTSTTETDESTSTPTATTEPTFTSTSIPTATSTDMPTPTSTMGG